MRVTQGAARSVTKHGITKHEKGYDRMNSLAGAGAAAGIVSEEG